MKDFNYYNRLIHELDVHVNELLVEVSTATTSTVITNRKKLTNQQLKDRSITDEEKIEDIMLRQQDIPPQKQIDIKEIYKDIGDGKWPDDFPQQEELDKWFQENSGTDYTIKDGKYAGKVLTSGVYDAIRVSKGLQSARSRVSTKRTNKAKGKASVCNCIELARSFSDKTSPASEMVKCPRGKKKKCYENWSTEYKDELKLMTNEEAQLHRDYSDECVGLYKNEMFNFDTRSPYVWSEGGVKGSPFCKSWNTDIKDSMQSIFQTLSSLLSQFFRVKNADNLKKKAAKGDVSAKINLYKKITIKFSEPVDFTSSGTRKDDAAAGFGDCVNNSIDIKDGDNIEFDVNSASPHTGGNTVSLSKGSKSLLMTFKTADRNVNQDGNITFVKSQADSTAKCKKIRWNGEITRLEK